MAIKNGAMVEIDPKTEKILKIYIVASKDQDQAAIIKTIKRIMEPFQWSWLKMLINKTG